MISSTFEFSKNSLSSGDKVPSTKTIFFSISGIGWFSIITSETSSWLLSSTWTLLFDELLREDSIGSFILLLGSLSDSVSKGLTLIGSCFEGCCSFFSDSSEDVSVTLFVAFFDGDYSLDICDFSTGLVIGFISDFCSTLWTWSGSSWLLLGTLLSSDCIYSSSDTIGSECYSGS